MLTGAGTLGYSFCCHSFGVLSLYIRGLITWGVPLWLERVDWWCWACVVNARERKLYSVYTVMGRWYDVLHRELGKVSSVLECVVSPSVLGGWREGSTCLPSTKVGRLPTGTEDQQQSQQCPHQTPSHYLQTQINIYHQSAILPPWVQTFKLSYTSPRGNVCDRK